jgi:hypothetical protein
VLYGNILRHWPGLLDAVFRASSETLNFFARFIAISVSSRSHTPKALDSSKVDLAGVPLTV